MRFTAGDNTQMKQPDVMTGRLIGYARISTAEQDLRQQVDALIKAGVHPDHIHTDTKSGRSAKRPGLEMALRDAVEGDTLVVWKLDRFGRSLFDLLAKMQDLEQRGIGFISLTDKFDTTSASGRLMIHVLAAISEFEVSLGKERLSEKLRAKKARGERIGPDRKIDVNEAVRMFYQDDADVNAVMKRFKLGARRSVYNYADAAVIWLLRGKDPSDFVRQTPRARWAKAERKAKKLALDAGLKWPRKK